MRVRVRVRVEPADGGQVERAVGLASPPRLTRFLLVRPEQAGIGLAPQKRTKAPSFGSRWMFWPAVTPFDKRVRSRGARTGVRIVRMASERNTSSNAAVNLLGSARVSVYLTRSSDGVGTTWKEHR